MTYSSLDIKDGDTRVDQVRANASDQIAVWGESRFVGNDLNISETDRCLAYLLGSKFPIFLLF